MMYMEAQLSQLTGMVEKALNKKRLGKKQVSFDKSVTFNDDEEKSSSSSMPPAQLQGSSSGSRSSSISNGHHHHHYQPQVGLLLINP